MSVINEPTVTAIRLLVAAAIVFTILSAPLSSHADGVCKSSPIPIDHVAVAEFSSPQCPGYDNDPFAKNAWEVARVQDGTVACVLPPYKEIGAAVASLVPCDRVESTDCLPRRDGLANAVTMRTPAACLRHGLPADLRLVCSQTTPNPLVSAVGNDEYWPMIAQLSSTECPPLDRALLRIPPEEIVPTSNAYLARRRPSVSRGWLAVCASTFNYRRDREVVVRRFRSSFCPGAPLGVAGTEHGLNSWIVLALDGLERQTLVACAITQPVESVEDPSARDEPKESASRAPNKGARFRRRAIGRAGIPEAPPLSRYAAGLAPTLHAEQCGGPAEERNAYRLVLDEDEQGRPYVKAIK